MNKILLFKVKRDLKNATKEEIESIVIELQEKFNINENSNVFEIEQKIIDEEYHKIIKK